MVPLTSGASRRMSILVVCPGCQKRFQVSDRFAGKSGPCPQCNTPIKVPAENEEVKVHTPTAFAEGGRSTTGQLLTKPIARKEIKVAPVAAVAIGGGVVTVLLVTWAAGGLIQGSRAIQALGLLLVSPPLVVAAYAFLRNDDLEPYRGTSLCIRTAICSVAYAALWAVYGYVSTPPGAVLTGKLWEWLFVLPPFFVTGALVALACFDLDFSSGFFHYAFYLLSTILLRWAAGMDWVWNVARGTAL